MQFFEKRRMRKTAHELLRRARHLRYMREDILKPAQMERLQAGESGLLAVLHGADLEKMDKAAEALHVCLDELAPPRPLQSTRENIEILAVALAVAMGFRAYFLQPFKIPTGSMQPTLNGIVHRAQDGRVWNDHFPFSILKLLVFGDRYIEIRAKCSGSLIDNQHPRRDAHVIVGPQRHQIPKDAELKFRNGDSVVKGDLLWSGIKTVGDHVFVDKVRWNFRRPRRGEIMVFNTDDMPGLPPATHYIKRLSAKPRESVSIRPPHLWINGQQLTNAPAPMRRIAERQPGYYGYTLAGYNSQPRPLLALPNDEFTLPSNGYLALGDNTRSSYDSRYWGHVPTTNMVGPALLVYWPYSRKRWGPTD